MESKNREAKDEIGKLDDDQINRELYQNAEIKFRQRELDLKQQDLVLREWEQKHSGLRSPLVLSIIAAVIGLLGNAMVAALNGYYQRALEIEKARLQADFVSIQHKQNLELEHSKAEASRILEMIRTGDPDKAAGNLEFLLEAGLIEDNADYIKGYLKKRSPGHGGSLPTATVENNFTGVRAHIYTHEAGLKEEDAAIIKDRLEISGIPTRIYRHRDPNPPDAMFIGARVPATKAQIALSAAPYKIRYMFRTDYPSLEGGDPAGLLIGIGYVSTHAKGVRGPTSEPIKISEKDLSLLSEPGISDEEFQLRLLRITRSDKPAQASE